MSSQQLEDRTQLDRTIGSDQLMWLLCDGGASQWMCTIITDSAWYGIDDAADATAKNRSFTKY